MFQHMNQQKSQFAHSKKLNVELCSVNDVLKYSVYCGESSLSHVCYNSELKWRV